MKTQKEIEKMFTDMGLGSKNARERYAFSFCYEGEHLEGSQLITEIDTKTEPLGGHENAKLESNS